MLKRAIVVGASSGIGAALARCLVQEGYLVGLVARRVDLLEALCDDLNAGGVQRAWAFGHDVRDTQDAPEVFERAVEQLDGLDLLVYAAGVMPPVAEDQYDTEVDRHIVEVNVIGAMSWLNLGARRFSVQGGGVLVGIGSVAGERGRRGNPAYCSSKAALHTFLESLRNRLSTAGVRVVTVKPGPVHTPMTEGRDDLPMAIDAMTAARRIYRAVAGGSEVAYVPVQWAFIMGVIRNIPSVLFRRMKV